MEEWKYVKNSKFYQVSNLGNIRGVGGTIVRKDGKPYTVKPCTLKTSKTKCGYLVVDLKLDLGMKYSVHRIVLETFNPVDNMDDLQVNHIDGNKTNNKLNNLEWTTRVENMQHALKTGLFNPQNRCGESHPMCKLSSENVIHIRELLKAGKYTQHEIALMFQVSDATISEIKTKRKRANN